MKLIKCHIENFGKLSNFDFNFSDGFNSIKEENGWGKTTFATFIKSMFYGLQTTQKRNLDENERKKFTPWQGGNFGGNIVFETNNKQYKIERFFGKNNSEDTFNIIDVNTGKKSKDFTENIGEEIFGLDEEAFERSSFIPQKGLNSSINESISNKLTNLIQGTTENFNYEESQEILNKKRVSLYNNKGTGCIQELESKIDDVMNKINELNTSSNAIDEIQKLVDSKDDKLAKLTLEQDKIKSQIKEYSKIQQKVANKELFDRLNKQVSSSEEEIKEKQNILNNQNTSLTEIDSYISLNKEVIQNENKIKIKSENDYVKERHNELTNYFGNVESIPSAEAIKEIQDNISQYNTLKSKTNASTPKEETNSSTGTNKNKIFILLAIASVVCFVIGVITIKSVLVLSVVLFIIGLLCLLIAGFKYLTNMINIKTNNASQIDYEQVQKDQTEILRLQKKIESFLSKYEAIDVDYSTAINNISSNRREFEKLKQQIEVSEKDNNELFKNIDEGTKKIEKYLAKFNISKEISNMTDKLLTLKETLIDLSKLKEKLSTEQEELENFKKDKNFNVNDEQIKDIDINDLQKAEKELQNQIDICREEKIEGISKINKIQDAISELDDLENEKEILENELSILNKELKAVKNAKKFLEEANESLSSKFLAPMKNGLNKYLKLITSQDFDNLQLDTDFNISFEEYGKSRDVDYYSKGYKNAIDLCMRLSLIDTLFDKEKPFIVLDDPFVNLDENKIENAKKFLRDLSSDYQIIYFSCHESRM